MGQVSARWPCCARKTPCNHRVIDTAVLAPWRPPPHARPERLIRPRECTHGAMVAGAHRGSPRLPRNRGCILSLGLLRNRGQKGWGGLASRSSCTTGILLWGYLPVTVPHTRGRRFSLEAWASSLALPRSKKARAQARSAEVPEGAMPRAHVTLRRCARACSDEVAAAAQWLGDAGKRTGRSAAKSAMGERRAVSLPADGGHPRCSVRTATRRQHSRVHVAIIKAVDMSEAALRRRTGRAESRSSTDRRDAWCSQVH